ncbi:MAG: hypothetical protein Q9217_004583 [Psora testacea]
MSLTSASESERKLDEVKGDCWHNGGSGLDIDSVLQRVSQLEAQLEVQKVLQRTEKLLLQAPSDKALPNQQATRVKHFVKFVFERTDRWKERQTQLRRLECDALKFCGLSYTIKEIHELALAQFDFLVANITDFVRRQRLSEYLYRDDIDRGIQAKFFDPEDEAALKEFLKSSLPSVSLNNRVLIRLEHIELRPSKRAKRTNDQTPSPDNHNGAQGDMQINREGVYYDSLLNHGEKTLKST